MTMFYNERTKGIQIEVQLVERSYDGDNSDWKVRTTEPIYTHPGECRWVPAGAEFRYRGTYDETEEEVRDYIMRHGILDTCDVRDADFEYYYIEDEAQCLGRVRYGDERRLGEVLQNAGLDSGEFSFDAVWAEASEQCEAYGKSSADVFVHELSYVVVEDVPLPSDDD